LSYLKVKSKTVDHCLTDIEQRNLYNERKVLYPILNKISSRKPLLVQLTVVTWISQFDIHCLQLGWKWPKKCYTESTIVAVCLFAINPSFIYCSQHAKFLPLAISIFFSSCYLSLIQSSATCRLLRTVLFPKAIITERGEHSVVGI